jgi:hypothetical protein
MEEETLLKNVSQWSPQGTRRRRRRADLRVRGKKHINSIMEN